MVENTGIEPVVPEAADLQSTASPLMLLLHLQHRILLAGSRPSVDPRFRPF